MLFTSIRHPILVVHTDSPDRILNAATEIQVETRPVPAGLREFDCMSQAHREVLAMACRGDRVMLLTADLVVSANALTHCESIFRAHNKLFIGCAGIRALQEGHIGKAYEKPRALLKWAWQNRHPMTTECAWPEGRSADLSRTYYTDGINVIARLCLPHPLAVRIDGRPLPFTPTIDVNLINNFNESEIHIVKDPDELALVELSPRDKDFARTGSTIEQRFNDGSFIVPRQGIQPWVLDHKIVLYGIPADCGDDAVVEKLLRG